MAGMKRSASGRIKLNELGAEHYHFDGGLMTPAPSPDSCARIAAIADLSPALPVPWIEYGPVAWTVEISELPPELLAKCLDIRSEELMAELLDGLPDNPQPVRRSRIPTQLTMQGLPSAIVGDEDMSRVRQNADRLARISEVCQAWRELVETDRRVVLPIVRSGQPGLMADPHDPLPGSIEHVVGLILNFSDPCTAPLGPSTLARLI